MKPLPDTNLLHELLTYCPESGEIKWRVTRGGKAKVGDTAGSTDRGYLRIRIHGSAYPAHRIAWALYYGEDPYPSVLDHINRDKTDNRISNLRLCTCSENNYNRGLPRNNTSGHRGVYYEKNKKTWRPSIRINGKTVSLGSYKTKEDAINARLKAEQEHGVFSREV